MRMTPIGYWVFQLILAGIGHSIVELLLREAIRLGLISLSPELVARFVPEIRCAINRLSSVRVDRDALR